MNKIAVVLLLGLLPLAGCATPYAPGPYAGYESGPYTAYDDDYDQGYDGYGPPVAYGQPGYGPGPAAGYYGPPSYPQPYAPAYYGAPPAYYGQQSTQGYSSSTYSSSCGCNH